MFTTILLDAHMIWPRRNEIIRTISLVSICEYVAGPLNVRNSRINSPNICSICRNWILAIPMKVLKAHRWHQLASMSDFHLRSEILKSIVPAFVHHIDIDESTWSTSLVSTCRHTVMSGVFLKLKINGINICSIYTSFWMVSRIGKVTEQKYRISLPPITF